MAKKVAVSLKRGIGVKVDMTNGRSLAFGPTARWRWKLIAGQLFLEVLENHAIAAHVPFAHVTAVSGPQCIFRDAQWK